MAASGERAAVAITRAHGRAGPPGETDEPRQVRQQRPAPPLDPEVEKALRRKTVTPEEHGAVADKPVPHWALTIAELKHKRDQIDVAIKAIEALYD